MNNKPLYIFDADGTLRRTIPDRDGPPFDQSEWELISGVAETMAGINWQRFRFGIASNQASVGRGLVAHDVAYQMLFDLATAVTGLVHPESAIQMCPHLPDDGCACRKPMPSMLNRIMSFFNTPASLTTFVGDAETDRRAAELAGCNFLYTKDFFYVCVE